MNRSPVQIRQMARESFVYYQAGKSRFFIICFIQLVLFGEIKENPSFVEGFFNAGLSHPAGQIIQLDYHLRFNQGKLTLQINKTFIKNGV